MIELELEKFLDHYLEMKNYDLENQELREQLHCFLRGEVLSHIDKIIEQYLEGKE